MAVNVQFCIEHHYFCDALYVWMKWEFPFLPRIGESVSPWFWIEEGTYDPDKIKSMFTSEGLASWDAWQGDFKSWLYEMGISVDTIANLSYFKGREDGCPYVHLLMQEER